MVADGGFATEGIDYVDLGKETAAIIKQIYEGKKVADIPVVILKDTKLILIRQSPVKLALPFRMILPVQLSFSNKQTENRKARG